MGAVGHRSLGRWVVGPLGRWAVGSLGRWAVGSLGRWVVLTYFSWLLKIRSLKCGREINLPKVPKA